VLFIHACTWEGMILQFIPNFFWDAPVWIKKPVFDCPICMAPWYGVLIMILSGWYPVNLAQPFIILAMAGGINVVASSFINREALNGADHTGGDN
jgi:hypothetical protein